MRLVLPYAILLGAIAACSPPDGSMYTLYRRSVLDARQRLHVATFDAAESEQYNQENCSVVLEQMQRRPGVTVQYWCEKGRFRK